MICAREDARRFPAEDEHQEAARPPLTVCMDGKTRAETASPAITAAASISIEGRKEAYHRVAAPGFPPKLRSL